MDVDRLTSHTFAALAHGFDLNEIVVIGWEAELSSGSVGQDSKDVIVAMSLQQHLRHGGVTPENELKQTPTLLFLEINHSFAK